MLLTAVTSDVCLLVVSSGGKLCTKLAKDLVVGDQLLSHTSLQPIVSVRSNTEVEECIEIVPNRSATFCILPSTLLGLRSSGTLSRPYGEEVYFALDHEELAREWMRNRFKLFRKPIRAFSTKQLSIPPYIVGYFMVNHTSAFSFKASCPEVFEHLVEQTQTVRGLMIRRTTPLVPNKSVKVEIDGESWRTFVRVNETRIFPDVYLCGDLAQRAQLFSGILDNVGYMSKINYTYDLCLRSDALTEQIKLLAISLGFYVTKTPRQQQTRLYISGDYEDAGIQCYDARKMARNGKQVKVNVSGFTSHKTKCMTTHIELSSSVDNTFILHDGLSIKK